MRISELDLSPAAHLCLEVADIHEVDRLLEHGTGRLIQRPEFSKGTELYEVVCELHRRGLTFSRPGGHIQGARKLEIFRLRAVVGLSLDEIAQRFNLTRGRVHQLLRLHFRLDGAPPAARAHRPRPTRHRPRTLEDRHRLYLLARMAIKRHRSPLTVTAVSRALASSPGNSSVHIRSSATALSMRTSRPDGWTLPPNCSQSPRSLSAKSRAGSATVISRTSPVRFSAAMVFHPQRFAPGRASSSPQRHERSASPDRATARGLRLVRGPCA
jgi:hypothetical protein